MARIVTKTSGFFIIGSALVILDTGNEVAFPDSAEVQEFKTEADATVAHEEQFPDQYIAP